jgi:hypothetical protein
MIAAEMSKSNERGLAILDKQEKAIKAARRCKRQKVLQ